ncbi:MAG: hypothetical protein N2449_08615 [Bacteroidales bacterium]|nr:hypothetical protein [Bacteroidales bacterium]
MGFTVRYLFLFCVLLFSCKAPLEEIKSTQQRWCVSQKGIYGINYHFTFQSNSSYQKLKLDSIYIHGQWKKDFHYSVLGKMNTETRFNKHDTILISVNISDTLQRLPIKLHYTLGNRKKCILINKMHTLKSLCTN